MHKRILITSIPSWNQTTGSNTFSSLFESFDSNDLANIYISGQLPDSNVCSRYFHIDEMEVVKSVFKRNLSTGREVMASKDSLTSTSVKRKRIRRYRILLWFRELCWKYGKWKSKELDEFLCDFNPEVLVFPIESYLYFNRLNQYIIKRCKPKKVIGYLWDDNFTYKQCPRSIIFKIERFFLRRQVKDLVKSCTDVLAISSKMKKECDKEFGVDSIVLTKPIFNKKEFEKREICFPIRILYTGKLIIGRDKTIAKIAEAIHAINQHGQKIILDIYTQTEVSEKMKKRISIPGCCVLHPPVPQSEVYSLQDEADVLLFAESLSDRDLTARLSFSTKLTDYLAVGKCIWGVGNADLGPIDYIKQEDVGLVSTDVKQIEDTLKDMTSDLELISTCSEKSYDLGKNNHSSEVIITRLHNLINS